MAALRRLWVRVPRLPLEERRERRAERWEPEGRRLSFRFLPLLSSLRSLLTSGSWSNRKTPASHAGNPGANPGESTHEQLGPVVQRPRRLAHIQETMVRFHPGPLRHRLGRQSADHLGLEPGMLWVRPPPEPLIKAERREQRAERQTRFSDSPLSTLRYYSAFGSMVKRTSCLASNEVFRVRVLVELLPIACKRKGHPMGDGTRLEAGGA